ELRRQCSGFELDLADSTAHQFSGILRSFLYWHLCSPSRRQRCELLLNDRQLSLLRTMSDPIHVAIVRTVKPGCDAAFEQALHDFIQRTVLMSGQMGVHVIRPAPGSDSRQYGIIRKFTDRDALRAFRASPEYLEWNHKVLDLTEGSGSAEELCGLESWFTLPGQPLRPFPQWKMALVTFSPLHLLNTLFAFSLAPLSP